MHQENSYRQPRVQRLDILTYRRFQCSLPGQPHTPWDTGYTFPIRHRPRRHYRTIISPFNLKFRLINILKSTEPPNRVHDCIRWHCSIASRIPAPASQKRPSICCHAKATVDILRLGTQRARVTVTRTRFSGPTPCNHSSRSLKCCSCKSCCCPLLQSVHQHPHTNPQLKITC